MSNPNNNKGSPSSSFSISVKLMEEAVAVAANATNANAALDLDKETPSPSVEIVNVESYNPTNNDNGVATDDAPATPTSHSNHSNGPLPAQGGHQVENHNMYRRVLSACNSNSTKLKCCGGFLVAAAAVGALTTSFLFTHPNDIQQQAMAAGSKGGKGPESLCPTAYCGMTIPAGETFKLEQDLVCTGDTADKGDTSVAITVEEGGTLDCNGNSIVQLNDELGKAVECYDDPVTECGLAWGVTGVLLKSDAKVENCRVSGWKDGLLIAPPDLVGGIVKDIKIDNVEATLNSFGLYYYYSAVTADRVEGSVKNRYVYFLYDSTLTSPCIRFNLNTHTMCLMKQWLPHLYLSHSSHHCFSALNHNRYGILISELDATVKVDIEDVKTNFNKGDGIFLDLGADSEVTLNNVEARYNGYDGSLYGGGVYVDTYKDPTVVPPAELILKGTNSVIGNQGNYGLYVSEDVNVVVSRGASLNAYINTGNGVQLADTTPTLTVKKGGAVNACGNSGNDLDGPGSSSFFPSDGKRYTCDDGVANNGNGFTSCDNTCPVCALN